MNKTAIVSAVSLVLGAGAVAQQRGAEPPPAKKAAKPADFLREGDAKARKRKDPLEGKAPPALQVSQWMNTKDGKPLDLADLAGKVVAIKFWGVW